MKRHLKSLALALAFVLFAVTARGQGLTGPSCTAPASWTPSLTFAGGAVGLTYGTQSGSYVQCGKIVVAEFAITLTAVGTSTGAAQIGGLPFTSANTSYLGMVLIGFYANLATATALNGYVGANATVLNLQIPGAAGTANATNSNFTATSVVDGAAIYLSQ